MKKEKKKKSNIEIGFNNGVSSLKTYFSLKKFQKFHLTFLM